MLAFSVALDGRTVCVRACLGWQLSKSGMEGGPCGSVGENRELLNGITELLILLRTAGRIGSLETEKLLATLDIPRVLATQHPELMAEREISIACDNPGPVPLRKYSLGGHSHGNLTAPLVSQKA